MQAVKSEWKKLPISSGNPVDADLQWYSIIRLCIVNDELEILDSLAKTDNSLQKGMTLVKPALKEIRRYKHGFRLFRNKALAHFNRDGKGNYQPMEEWMAKTTSIPRSKGEQELIYNCVDLAVTLLTRIYGPVYQEFQKARLDKMHQAISDFEREGKLRPEVFIDDIADDINKIGIELGLSIEGHPILQRHPSNDLPQKPPSR